MKLSRFFEVHGVTVALGARVEEASEAGAGAKLLDWIGEDLSFFEVESLKGEPELRFVIGADGEALGRELRRLPRAFRTRMCGARGWGAVRACDYGEGVFAVSRMERPRPRLQRTLEISLGDGSARALDTAYEALYAALLSALGESLDLRRLHRVHALGLSREGQGQGGGKKRTALVLLPAGAGKSAMAALLANDYKVGPEFRIFSDESPLHRDGLMHPFPVRGALRPEVARALGVGPGAGRIFRRRHFAEKLLLPFDPARVARAAAPPDWILVGKRASSARIRPDNAKGTRLAAFSGLLDSSVIGRGLAQMSEYMIRGDSWWNLPAIAWDRFHSARKLLEGARVGRFDVCDDARQNAEVLADFLA